MGQFDTPSSKMSSMRESCRRTSTTRIDTQEVAKMKPYWILLFAVLLLVVPVSANTALNFQQPADFSAQVEGAGTGGSYWVESANGGNNYVFTSPNFYLRSATASPMTYSATTCLPGSLVGMKALLYDNTKTVMTGLSGSCTSPPCRFEIKIIGSIGHLYRDGIEIGTTSALTQNPSYIGWAAYSGGGFLGSYFDDVVWGSSEPLTDTASDKYVYGMPETQSNGTPYYVIQKDFINPAASGFYTGAGALINSHHFTSTFSKGNNNSDTINLQGYTTGVNVLSNSTGTAYTGTISWDLDAFFASNPNYGFYAMHSPSSLKYSDLISYIGNGAIISWNKPQYSQGETGAIITVVSSGGYWNTALYTYRVDVININGVVQASYPVTTQTATISHTWTATQPIGIYYAEMIATPRAGGSDILMNYAICNVNAYLTLYGYVFDAQTTNPINQSTVAILQGTTWANTTTPASGYYSAGNMSEGASITAIVNATGYETYQTMFTPLRVGSIQLNFTLMSLSPTYTGIALGGIARTPPYNQTIDSATISIQNATAGGNFTATTNSVGFYIQNNMPNNYWWSILGSKTGFLNSTIYQKLVIGA